MIVFELVQALFLAMQCSSPRWHPSCDQHPSIQLPTSPAFHPVLTVIFATMISRAESVPATECSHPKTESRVLDDLADHVAFVEKKPGFRKAFAGEVLLHWATPPYPPVAFHRRKITTNAQSGREVPFRCQTKISYTSTGFSTALDVHDTYGIISFPKRSRTMSCTTTGGASGNRDKLADPNSAVL